MGRRITVRKQSRKPSVGEMRNRIKISKRELREPGFGAVDFDELFKRQEFRWALVRTTAGKVLFDGVGVDRAMTHEIWIRFDPAVDSETWVLLEDGTRLDVLMVEDPEERREFLRLLCSDRGDATQEAAKA